jgi:hypothetical protein
VTGVFHDVDASLQLLLDDAGAPSVVRDADASFVTPDLDYKPTQPTINLYLHQVSENRRLRDESRVLERAGNVVTSRLPALRVDCTYLVTAWSAETAGAKVAAEHRLLGLALTWFSRFPTLEDRFMAGSLKAPPQPLPVPIAVAQSGDGQALSHFWTALRVPPRPAFEVTVTVSMQPSDDTEYATVPEEVTILSGSLVDPQLSGRVLDHLLAAVPGATVTAVGTGRSATTDARGAYAVPGVDFGRVSLRVQAAGRADAVVAVDYARNHQFHDVILPAP